METSAPSKPSPSSELMNFFSKVASASLAASMALACVPLAGVASPVQQSFVQEETQSLINTASSVGVQFHVNDPTHCTPGMMGMANLEKHVLICLDNHSDRAELADTIRHELLHVVQVCLGDRLIYPDRIEYTRTYAQTDLGWNILGYPVEQWDQEGEARTLAHFLDESDVEELLVKACR